MDKGIIQHPFYHSHHLHRNFVDDVKYFGDCIISRNTKGDAYMWRPQYGAQDIRAGKTISSTNLYHCFHSSDWCEYYYTRLKLSTTRKFLGAAGRGCALVFDMEQAIKDIDFSGMTQSTPKAKVDFPGPKDVVIRDVAFNQDDSNMYCVNDAGSLYVCRRTNGSQETDYS